MRSRRMWVIYRDIERRYSPMRRYFRFYDNGAFTADKVWASSASLYETKNDAASAVILFVTRHPEYIGRLKITHALR